MNRIIQILVVLTLGLGNACGGKAEPTPAQPEAAAPAPAKPVAPVVKAYDDLREALALDDLDKAKAAAAKLGEAAGAEYAKITELVVDSAKIADIEAMRTRFGEISRALLTAIQSAPALGEGLLAFRCPMAEGYQKWVQLSSPMRNPYMGQKMLECGSKAKLEP